MMPVDAKPESLDLGTRRDQWCRRVLGSSAPEEPQAVRKGMYRRLRQDGFTVSENWETAAQILFSRSGESPESAGYSASDAPAPFLLDEERRLLGEIDRLAEVFFSLPPVARQGWWEGLSAAGGEFPRVTTRLTGLQKGLTLDVPSFISNDEWVDRLLKIIQTLYCLAPLERAKRRDAFFASIADEDFFWRQAANRLRKYHPPWAALLPEFVDQVALGSPVPIPSSPPTNARARQKAEKEKRKTLWAKIGWAAFVLACLSLGYLQEARESPPSDVQKQLKKLDADTHLRKVREAATERKQQLDNFMHPSLFVLPDPDSPDYPKTPRHEETLLRLMGIDPPEDDHDR